MSASSREPRLRVREATGRGEGAISILIVEGAAIADGLARLGVSSLPSVGSFGLRRLDLGRQLFEDALIVVPDTACVEIHVHGNVHLVDRVLRALDASPAPRSCELDGLRAEILEAARYAPSRVGLEACLHQLSADGLLAPYARGADTWRDAHARGLALLPFLEPRRVVLRGRTNAGKSTLFNLLLGRSRVRVGSAAGLTRDAVEELVVLEGGVPIRLVDVAGEREVVDAGLDASLERDAIASGRSMRDSADLVLALSSCEDPEPFSVPGELRIFTHADLVSPGAFASDSIVCSLTEDAPGEVARRIGVAIQTELGIQLPAAGPAWVGPRTRAHVLSNLREP